MGRATTTEAQATVQRANRKQKLLDMLRSHTEILFFKTRDGVAWVGLPTRNSDSLEYMKTSDGKVRDWLLLRGMQCLVDFPTTQEVETVQDFLGAYIREAGPTRDIYRRVAPDGEGGGWLDLGPREAVHYTAAGWSVVPTGSRDSKNNYIVPPFFRPTGYLSLPEPEPGGSLALLRPFVNCPTDFTDPDLRAQSNTNFIRMVAWLIGALMTGVSFYGRYWLIRVFGERVHRPAKPPTRSAGC